MVREQCFLVCHPQETELHRKHCFLVCPCSGNIARKQCFWFGCLQEIWLSNVSRVFHQCFLVCPRLENMTRKHRSLTFRKHDEKLMWPGLLTCGKHAYRKQCVQVSQHSRSMARKQWFLITSPCSGNMPGKQCFLVCFSCQGVHLV